MESTNAVAQYVGGQEVLTGRILTLDEVFKNFDAVTPKDIQRVAQKYLAPEYLRIAAITPQQIDGELNKMLLNK